MIINCSCWDPDGGGDWTLLAIHLKRAGVSYAGAPAFVRENEHFALPKTSPHHMPNITYPVVSHIHRHRSISFPFAICYCQISWHMNFWPFVPIKERQPCHLLWLEFTSFTKQNSQAHRFWLFFFFLIYARGCMWVIHVITKSDESTFTSGHKSLCSLNEKLIILMEINPKCVFFFNLSTSWLMK